MIGTLEGLRGGVGVDASPPAMMRLASVPGDSSWRTAFEYYPSLARVADYVESQHGRRVTLADAARVAGLERTYFSVYFRRRVGVSFREWLRRYRIALAVQLLGKRDLLLERVAYESGFEDRRTFQRAFKAVVGVPPSEFRRRLRLGLVTRCRHCHVLAQLLSQHSKQMPRR